MKKLVLKDGRYEVTEASGVNAIWTALYAPVGGLLGDAQIGGTSRANTIGSLVIGAALGASVCYPLASKAIAKTKKFASNFSKSSQETTDSEVAEVV